MFGEQKSVLMKQQFSSSQVTQVFGKKNRIPVFIGHTHIDHFCNLYHSWVLTTENFGLEISLTFTEENNS